MEEAILCRGYIQPLAVVKTTKLSTPVTAPLAARKVHRRSRNDGAKNVDAIVGQEVELSVTSDAIHILNAQRRDSKKGTTIAPALDSSVKAPTAAFKAAASDRSPPFIEEAKNGGKRFASSLPLSPITICAQCVALVGAGGSCKHQRVDGSGFGGNAGESKPTNIMDQLTDTTS